MFAQMALEKEMSKTKQSRRKEDKTEKELPQFS